MSEHLPNAHNRLPNGLTPEQDAAFDALARAYHEWLMTNRGRKA